MISWWLCTSHPQQGASIFPLTPCPPREHWLALFEWLSLVGKKYPLALSLSLSFGGEVGSGVEGDPVWLYTTCTRPFLLNIWDCRSVESRNKKKKSHLWPCEFKSNLLFLQVALGGWAEALGMWEASLGNFHLSVVPPQALGGFRSIMLLNFSSMAQSLLICSNYLDV